MPATVSVGDPSAMLQQRPDIRAAERRLASSNAQIGEHVADFFPKLTLFGDIGFSAADPGHLCARTISAGQARHICSGMLSILAARWAASISRGIA